MPLYIKRYKCYAKIPGAYETTDGAFCWYKDFEAMRDWAERLASAIEGVNTEWMPAESYDKAELKRLCDTLAAYRGRP